MRHCQLETGRTVTSRQHSLHDRGITSQQLRTRRNHTPDIIRKDSLAAAANLVSMPRRPDGPPPLKGRVRPMAGRTNLIKRVLVKVVLLLYCIIVLYYKAHDVRMGGHVLEWGRNVRVAMEMASRTSLPDPRQ